MTHSASAGGLSEAEFMARASGWAGAIGPSHTVWITGASAPEVAGGRVHTVYGGVANTVWEWKDLNAPIELEGEPMQGPAAHDSASDKLDVFCTKRGIGKPMPLQAPKAILITNPSSYISGSSFAAPKAAPPCWPPPAKAPPLGRPPEAPPLGCDPPPKAAPPPLGCTPPPTLISCSGCDVHGRLYGGGPFIAGYAFWCSNCDPDSAWVQTNTPPWWELKDPYRSVGCDHHSDEEEDDEEEEEGKTEEEMLELLSMAGNSKGEVHEKFGDPFHTSWSIEATKLHDRQIQRWLNDPNAERINSPPLPSWPHLLAPFDAQRGVYWCPNCRCQQYQGPLQCFQDTCFPGHVLKDRRSWCRKCQTRFLASSAIDDSKDRIDDEAEEAWAEDVDDYIRTHKLSMNDYDSISEELINADRLIEVGDDVTELNCNRWRYREVKEEDRHIQQQQMEREEEWGWTGADRAAEHAPNEWGWENELHSGTKISEELPESPGCGLPGGAMKEPQGFKKGYSIRNQVSPGSQGGILSAGSDSYHRSNNERAEQRKRSNDAMMKRSRMKRETIISEREEQRAMMKRETILSEIAAEYHYNMSEREDPWRLDQGSQWRPLTSSDSDRLRCSAEDETDDNDIIRGYFVGTINGMFWFKPHDKRMGQFPVNYLISESWEEEFTREYPNIWLKHGVSYCFIDPHHLKRSSGA